MRSGLGAVERLSSLVLGLRRRARQRQCLLSAVNIRAVCRVMTTGQICGTTGPLMKLLHRNPLDASVGSALRRDSKFYKRLRLLHKLEKMLGTHGYWP